MAPVRAGQIATIRTRQLLARRDRHRRFQRTGAEADPSLQMAGAGLQHHTRSMPIGTHALHHRRFGSIEVDENVTRVLVSGIGLNIDVASFAVANAQKSDGAFASLAPMGRTRCAGLRAGTHARAMGASREDDCGRRARRRARSCGLARIATSDRAGVSGAWRLGCAS